MQLTHSLKAPGCNPRTSTCANILAQAFALESWFQAFAFDSWFQAFAFASWFQAFAFELILYRYATVMTAVLPAAVTAAYGEIASEEGGVPEAGMNATEDILVGAKNLVGLCTRWF
jgi:hypothetical protein